MEWQLNTQGEQVGGSSGEKQCEALHCSLLAACDGGAALLTELTTERGCQKELSTQTMSADQTESLRRETWGNWGTRTLVKLSEI